MKDLRLLLAKGGAIAFLLVLTTGLSDAQVFVNPWVGRPVVYAPVVNPWTGRVYAPVVVQPRVVQPVVAVGPGVVNPWTGTVARGARVYNPWTGRTTSARVATNPWTGQRRVGVNTRRGSW